MFLNYWILPILFILHDFEEMIVMPIWKKRYHEQISGMRHPYFGAVTNGQAFSVGVLEEMLIFICVSIVSYVMHSDGLYLAFLIVYTLHFLMHYRMCLTFHGYVPGVASATLELPIMIWLIISYWQKSQMTLGRFIIFFVLAYAVMIINLRVMHKLMPNIQTKMAVYTKR